MTALGIMVAAVAVIAIAAMFVQIALDEGRNDNEGD
jgi:hypothetical protein